jgi:hypothetical protein
MEILKRKLFGNAEDEIGGDREEGWWRGHDG